MLTNVKLITFGRSTTADQMIFRTWLPYTEFVIKDKHKKNLLDHWAWRVKLGYDEENIGIAHGIHTELMKRGDNWTPEVFLEILLAALRNIARPHGARPVLGG